MTCSAFQEKDPILKIKGNLAMFKYFWKNLCHCNCAGKAS